MTTRFTMILAGLLAAGSLQAASVFVNGLAISGASGDAYGTSVNDGRLGFFSDIYYDSVRNQWWALSDRGPGGGTLNYDTRVQRFNLDIDPALGTISNFSVAETVKFTNNGTPFNGIAPNPSNVLGNSLDPEGFVVHPDSGHFFVSDEYGPALLEFDRSGALIRTLTTPANLLPRDGSGVPNFASDTGNVAGKASNSGFEGLAISPDGRYLFAMLQKPMLDEVSGTFNRIVKFDVGTGLAVAQYAYQMEATSQGRGISSLVAINDHEFLVLERNNRGVGIGATFATANKKVFRIDITGATDVSSVDLDAVGAVFTRVTKNSTPFVDLGANALAALGNKNPEKLEGLAIGPRLNDGSYFMLAGTDNDYSVSQNGTGTQFDVYLDFSLADPYASSIQCPLGQTTGCFLTSNNAVPATLTSSYSLLPGLLYGYKVAQSDLSTFVAPQAPEPGTYFLLLSGCAAIFGIRSRRRRA